MSLSTKKVLDDAGLAYFWEKIKSIAGGGSGGGIPVVEATRSGGALSVTVDGITELSDGVAVAVKLPSDAWNTSTSSVTLNVNSLGAKSVYNFNGNIVKLSELSPSEIKIFVYAVNTTSYKNTWRMLDEDLAYEGIAHGTVTGSGTSLTMTANGFKLKINALIAAKFNIAVVASATLNVNARGAKPIYYKGSSITAGVINVGDTAFLMYDGVNWQVLAIDTVVGNAPVYGTCTPQSSVASMTATTNRPLTKIAGATATIRFDADVAVAGPTLKVGNINAQVKHKGVNMPANTITSGDTAQFVYDGTYWNLIAIDNLGGGSYADGDAISY